MRRIKYLIITTLFLFPTCVNAASVSLKANSSSIVQGNSVTVTATISDSAAIFFTEGTLTCSGAGVNKSVSMSWDNTDNSKKSKSFSLSVKSSQVGTITCKTSGVKFTGGSSSGWTNLSSKPITINVVKPREKSTNNNLKSLSVEGYSISPDFNKDTLEYIVNLESNIEKIKINASKEDGYASLSGTGEKEVQEGDNIFEIVVTSETGKSKVYKLNAVVKDSNPIIKTINGKDYTVVKRESALTKPENFEATKVIINEIEIPSFYNEKTSITLIGLKDVEGNIYLYQYNQENDTYTKYETLTSISQTIIFENTDEKIEGYEPTTTTINEKEYNVYQNKNNKDYVLIYGMSLESGEKNWYLYNLKEQSIQIYIKDLINNMETSFNKTIEEYKLGIIAMAGLSLLLLIIIIIQIALKNKMKKKLLKKLKSQKELLEQERKSREELENKELKSKTSKKTKE